MLYENRCAKINVKVLIILVIILGALVTSLFAARQVRRGILSKMSLDKGEAAFKNEDWPTAYRNFSAYLGRNPDDVEILKKYAESRLSIRPLDADAVKGAIAAYRRVMQLDPLDRIASDKLAMLYAGIGNFEELAYIARIRIENDPNDREAQLWQANALINLGKTNEARKKLGEFLAKLEALPDKYIEYVQACALLSQIDDSAGERAKALENLTRAVNYLPESVEALVYRAKFYRATPGITGMSKEDMSAAARKDLEAADDIGTENPRIRLALGAEWMAHGEFDRADAELKAAESLPQEILKEHFFDLVDWTVARFLLASELAIRREATTEDAALADEVLAVLTEKRHRILVIPNAVALYVAAGRIADARSYLNDYLDTMYTQEGPTKSGLKLAYLQALVAKAEEKLYVVIDVLQPAIVSDASRPELWQLLAESYSRTDQTRRAVSALTRYLRLRPNDPKMTLQLAREYLRLRNWSSAFETARLAESLDPPNIIITKLLRLEASINVNISQAAEQGSTIDTARFAPLSVELADLRKQNPEQVDVRILQAIIADTLGKPDEAERELKLAIEECKEPLRARMQLVNQYVKYKRMTDAVSICRTACELHSTIAEPWLVMTSLHVKNADYDSAASCLRQGLEVAVGKWERRVLAMQLALVELLYLDRATGKDLLTELAAQDDQEVRARLLLLNIREIQEDQATAEKLIKELRDSEGESGLDWRLHQASLWLASDDWRSKQPDITGYLQYCINSDPGWSEPPLLLAKMYENLQDFGRVEDTYRQALIRNPSATDVADKLVTLLEQQRRFSDAEKVLQQIQANPTVSSAWRIRNAVNTGDFSRAIEELTVRVSNNDRDVNSRILLARLVYWETKDAEQAFAYLKEAEAITPASLALTAAKVSILKAEGQGEEARQILNDYVANINDFGAYMMRAAYLAREGEFERAEQDYRKLATFSDQGVAGYQLWSNFYARNQQLDKAVTVLEQGLNENPANLRLKRSLMKTLFARNLAQDRQRALEMLAALEKELPQDPELMKLRAFLMLEKPTPQSLAAARKNLENVVKLEPTSVEAHLMLIRIAMQEKRYEDARNSAIRALGSNPDNPALLSARAGAELLLKNTQMAAQLAQMALQKDPNDAQARGVLVAVALEIKDQGLLEQGTQLVQMALQKDPNDTQARDMLITVALEIKDPGLLEQSRTLIESAIGRDPTNEQLLLSRARILVAMDNPQAAIPELEAYCRTEKGSSSVTAIVMLADLYRLSGDMDRAKQRIEQAEQIDGNSVTVIHARFLWLVAQKRFDELSQVSSKYLSAKEQNPATLVAAATILASLDSITLKQEGLKLFEQAVAIAPTSKEARLGLASTLYQTGDAERAVTIYEELLRQYPNDIQALNDLAWILQEHDQNYAAALELADRGLSIALKDFEKIFLLDTRGTILSNLAGRLADARNDFEKIVELSPSDTRQKAKALLNLGRICVKLDDLVQAKKHLKDALEIDEKIDVFTAIERTEIAKIIQESGIQAVNR